MLPLIALCAWAPTAGASARQTVTFEAPRELLSASTRAATLDQIAAFGVTRVRQLVYWRDFAPAPESKTKPAGFDASEPGRAIPRTSGTTSTGSSRRRKERGDRRHADAHRPGAASWATKAKRDNYTEPDAKEFQAFATAMGRRYGDAVNTWSVWNEPNQPQFLRPQYKNGKAYSPKLYRKLYQAAAEGHARDAVQRAATRS